MSTQSTRDVLASLTCAVVADRSIGRFRRLLWIKTLISDITSTSILRLWRHVPRPVFTGMLPGLSREPRPILGGVSGGSRVPVVLRRRCTSPSMVGSCGLQYRSISPFNSGWNCQIEYLEAFAFISLMRRVISPVSVGAISRRKGDGFEQFFERYSEIPDQFSRERYP